jgi:hypothetical protein
MAEKIMCPDQRLACLYCLLFYTVLAYLQRSLLVSSYGTQSTIYPYFAFSREKKISKPET